MRWMLAAALMIPGVATVGAAQQAVSTPTGAFRYTGTLTQGGLIRGDAPRGTVSLTLDGEPVGIADGRFVAGFDRDAGQAAVLAATLADGRVVRQTLAIAPRDWNISRLSSLPKYPVPSAEFQRIRPGELAQIVAARAQATDAAGWRQDFVWPVTGRISTRFGSQRIYQNGEAGSYHSGIDIARATGTIVVAPADGVVILAARTPFTLEGNLLMLDHGMGLNSAFLHLSRIDVTPGDHVRQGQPIGLVGRTGRATGPHLHWSLRWHDAKLDPLLVAGAM
ncbi:M23 family metallopeptidase [Sphingomonas oligophenolica]|uniref:M23 family metallopeptidase n=2 Tax=Sphingomonas oligophenolica TaxID=301154 RepID=A0A502CMH6_9SPHN|nr:M23 family metallopeptidase [Sphingomonas oligophenolica]TPG13750.1 M23 family metallopeptidase [Sphingomonas oligophenolica]